jgi:hypothetical protein
MLLYDVNLGYAYNLLRSLYRDFDKRKDWGTRTVGEVTANPIHVLGNAAGHIFDQQLAFMFNLIDESPRRKSLDY